jgi:hypothetical protein
LNDIVNACEPVEFVPDSIVIKQGDILEDEATNIKTNNYSPQEIEKKKANCEDI